MNSKQRHIFNLATFLLLFVFPFMGHQSTLYAASSAATFVSSNSGSSSISDTHQNDEIANYTDYAHEHFVESEEEISEEEEHINGDSSKVSPFVKNSYYPQLQKIHDYLSWIEKKKVVPSTPLYLRLGVFRL